MVFMFPSVGRVSIFSFGGIYLPLLFLLSASSVVSRLSYCNLLVVSDLSVGCNLPDCNMSVCPLLIARSCCSCCNHFNVNVKRFWLSKHLLPPHVYVCMRHPHFLRTNIGSIPCILYDCCTSWLVHFVTPRS